MLGYRKIRLQRKVLAHLKEGKNLIRYQEQKEVYKKLFNPKILFNKERIEYEEVKDKYTYTEVKTFNVLTVNCKKDKLYKLSLGKKNKE